MEPDQTPNEVEAATPVEAVEIASTEVAVSTEASADPATSTESSAAAIEAAPPHVDAAMEPQQASTQA